MAAVAVAYQVILPQITTWFQFVGTKADAGLYSTPGGAKNAVILGVGLVVFTTIVNMIGVKLMARINNVGVAAELVGVVLLIILLAFHIKRGPGRDPRDQRHRRRPRVGLLRRVPHRRHRAART